MLCFSDKHPFPCGGGYSSYRLTVFCQQSHVARVGAPHHVLDLGNLDGGQGAFLLHVEQRDAVGIAQQQRACACVEDFLAARHLDFLHDFILQVLNQQLQRRRKSVTYTDQVPKIRFIDNENFLYSNSKYDAQKMKILLTCILS